MLLNIHSPLTRELLDKEYRDSYVASQIAFGLPLQIRALRKQKPWTQEELADAADMTQPRIAEIERPSGRKFNLETLLRIASAFDVALEVRFVPFSDLVRHGESFDPDTFAVASFANELEAAMLPERSFVHRSLTAHTYYGPATTLSFARPKPLGMARPGTKVVPTSTQETEVEEVAHG